MDRCRCEDYKRAVSTLRFYTVGTHRPDIIDNYDRNGYVAVWIKHGVDYTDMKFTKPKAFKMSPGAENESDATKRMRKIERMWCPYMTPVQK